MKNSNEYWSTADELRFIKSLNPVQFTKYVEAIKHRVAWGGIRKSKIYRFLGISDGT